MINYSCIQKEEVGVFLTDVFWATNEGIQEACPWDDNGFQSPEYQLEEQYGSSCSILGMNFGFTVQSKLQEVLPTGTAWQVEKSSL